MSARIRERVATLNPGYAALVMATGIVSTGMDFFGWQILSVTFLIVTVIAFVILLVAYVWRAIAYPQRVLTDAVDPGVAFGYFTLVAAPNVLAIRLAIDDRLVIGAVLSLASVPIWLVLTYAVPGALIAGRRNEPVLHRANGSWFMWVVGTQSIAASAATFADVERELSAVLAPLAVSFWSVGVILYLMLVGLVTVHLLEIPVPPHALSPTYWVYMGATAISVLAAARILELPATLPVIEATRDVVSGVAFMLWAYGTWWIPLLLAVAIWRHLVRRQRSSYEPTLWSVVFPLGMYASGTASYGRITGIGFMIDIARVSVWVGLAVWVAVSVSMGRNLLRPQQRGAATVQDETS